MKLHQLLIALVAFTLTVVTLSQAQGQQPPQRPTQPEPINPSEVTEQEIIKVVKITDSVNDIQVNSEKKVRALIDSSAISYERFEEIVLASQNPQAAQSLQLTQEEQKVLGEIQPELAKINQKAQQDFLAIIDKHNMEPQRFQQIMQAAQQHQSLADRIEAKRDEGSSPEQ